MEKSFEIRNLGCAHCGGKIEDAIKKLDGVEDAILNFPMRKIKIKGDITETLLEEINRIADKIEVGVEIVPNGNNHTHHKNEHHHNNDECCHNHSHEHPHNCNCEEHNHSHSHTEHFEIKNKINLDILLFILGVLIFLIAIIAEHIFHFKYVFLLYVAAYLLIGFNVLKTTFKNVLKGNLFDENFLMTIATIGAIILGEYSEAVGVVLFFKIGELFENYAVLKSRKAITDIATLKVDKATVLMNDEYISIDSDNIKIGDILLIKTGERIPADGILSEGESKLDTSAINGEPVPLVVRKGDKIMSGCINLADTFTMTATAVAAESMISKISQAVEEAASNKPQIDRFITRFSKIYTPIVIITAMLTAVLGTIITGEIRKWIYSALTFLVISCPCALVLSVPLAYFSGIGAASKLGILFKGGNSIEALSKIKAVIFDKTGTLTNGSFSITDICSCNTVSEAELLKICGSCEQISTHPIAESITLYCHNNGIELNQPESSGELAGRGVYAVLEGKNILCGNEKMMIEKNIPIPTMPEIKLGNVVYTAINNKIIGRIIVSDSIKNTSKQAVSQLKQMGLHTVMLTGDKEKNAEAVGKMINIDDIKGDLMPDEKLAEMNKLRKQYGSIMFIGDGINDAPVLAGADIGGAMQNGSDIAIEAADAVFMNSEPIAVVSAKKIADTTQHIAYQNIFFALGIKALVIILGILGHPNMWLAVFADSGVAMLLILNSIRTLKSKNNN
ncbi:MAG: heavy metal translocating P-type ATPase [Ruminococcus sp.]|nr:heavy metal translocating P-type ATPase [Ruminococcus sp.]